MDPIAILQDIFGYDSFRTGQNQAVQAILTGRDALCIMPTGAGKSLCYQVPALCLEGTTLVISPLISLMQDQVNALKANDVPAAYFNSALPEDQYKRDLARFAKGQFKLVYVAPERLSAPSFQAICQKIKIPLVAVDEAHCISQWGQDFRPHYLETAGFIASLPQRPVVAAFTATAARPVQEDIKLLLGLSAPAEILTGYDRPNLTFEIQKPADKKTALLKLVQEHPDQSGIIYTATRKAAEEAADYLRRHNIPCQAYHAGMDEQKRSQIQEDFLYDRIPVIACTNAFGMGIDKSNVSYVIHYQMPGSLENYYQEAGRAGRDGSPATCILFWSGKDIQTQQFFIDQAKGNEEKKRQDQRRLQAMIDYAQTRSCLRNQILQYFGEHPAEGCGRCSNCRTTWQETDVTETAMKLFAGIVRTGSRFGAARVAEILAGADTEFTRSRSLNSHVAYQKLAPMSQKDILELISALKDEGYLTAPGKYPILQLTPKAAQTIKSHTPILIKTGKTTKRSQKADSGLLAELKKTRTALAREENLPAYMVFPDATLADMAAKKPRTKTEFLRVSGVGQTKLRKYGAAFLKTIQQWNRENR